MTHRWALQWALPVLRRQQTQRPLFAPEAPRAQRTQWGHLCFLLTFLSLCSFWEVGSTILPGSLQWEENHYLVVHPQVPWGTLPPIQDQDLAEEQVLGHGLISKTR